MRVLTCLVIAGLAASAAGESLGDAARKEAERRRRNREAGVKARAFSDADAPRPDPSASPSAAPGAGVPVPPALETPAGPDASDERARQEQVWRSRWAAAVARRDHAKKMYEYYKELWLAPGEYYVDDKGRKVIGSTQQLQGMVARAKADWDAAEKALGDLEDDARRAGALPGWLR
jgi:hypothetical protein